MKLNDKLKNDDMCFACGKQNPISLQLDFYSADDNLVRAEFKPHKNYQGFQDILHGGIITTVLDEAMAKAVAQQGIQAVTAEINVRFKKAVPVDKEYIIYGKVNKQKKNLIFTESFLQDKNNEQYASASAKFMGIVDSRKNSGSIS